MSLRIGLAVSLLLTFLSPAKAWVQVKTDTGIPVYWPEGQTTMKLSKKLPAGWSEEIIQPLVQAAVAPWLELSCFSFEFENEGFAGPGVGDGKDRVNWMLWTQKDWPFSSSQLAVTLVEFVQKTGEIVDADIYVNIAQKSFDLNAECDPNAVALDLQGVLTHEFGHFFGLDHTQVPLATMVASTEPGDCTKRTLHQDDIDGFCATYTNLPQEPDTSDPPSDADVSDTAAGDMQVVESEHDSTEGCQLRAQSGASTLWWLALMALVAIRRRRGFFTV